MRECLRSLQLILIILDLVRRLLCATMRYAIYLTPSVLPLMQDCEEENANCRG